jgi:NAD(P)H-flavin reductase
MVAGGTGLAPIKSILGEIGHAADPPRTSLFVGARSREDLYDLESLTGYAKRSPWLRIIPAISESLGSPYESGRLPDVVARYGPWHGRRAVVAGPRPMVALMLRELPELGVPEQHIAYDPE